MSPMHLSMAICAVYFVLSMLGVPGLSTDWALGMICGVWISQIGRPYGRRR